MERYDNRGVGTSAVPEAFSDSPAPMRQAVVSPRGRLSRNPREPRISLTGRRFRVTASNVRAGSGQPFFATSSSTANMVRVGTPVAPFPV